MSEKTKMLLTGNANIEMTSIAEFMAECHRLNESEI